MFEIVEVDRDYNTVTDIKSMEFESREAAEKWCRDETWTGHFYFVSKLDLNKEDTK
jgi:hypothetical protein